MSIFKRAPQWPITAIFTGLLSACAAVAPPGQNVALLEGPPIRDMVTSFDRALICMKGKVAPQHRFSVGAVLDLTGKEQITEGGSGKFITQGAGDIVQSALFTAGLTVLNRRDPRVIEAEMKWGLQAPKNILASSYFVTGSINSLDFIPGGGFDARIAGVGPAYRQNRILVGLDLFLTEAKSGRIVSSVSLQKQFFTSEFGFGIGRFIGETLTTIDIGWKEREAVSFAMREMLKLASFELLSQVVSPAAFGPCREEIGRLHADLDNMPSALALKRYQQAELKDATVPPDASGPEEPNEAGSPDIRTPANGAPIPSKGGAGSSEAIPNANGAREASPDTEPAPKPDPARNLLIIQ